MQKNEFENHNLKYSTSVQIYIISLSAGNHNLKYSASVQIYIISLLTGCSVPKFPTLTSIITEVGLYCPRFSCTSTFEIATILKNNFEVPSMQYSVNTVLSLSDGMSQEQSFCLIFRNSSIP